MNLSCVPLLCVEEPVSKGGELLPCFFSKQILVPFQEEFCCLVGDVEARMIAEMFKRVSF